MPITYVWDNDEQTIVKFVYSDPVTVEEIRQMDEGASEMLDTVSHSVVVIADATTVTRLPDDLLTSYPLLARNRGFRHPNLRASIMVLNNTFFESLLSIFGRLYGKMRFSHSLQEAYNMVKDGKV